MIGQDDPPQTGQLIRAGAADMPAKQIALSVPRFYKGVKLVKERGRGKE